MGCRYSSPSFVILSEAKDLLPSRIAGQILRRFAPQNDRGESPLNDRGASPLGAGDAGDEDEVVLYTYPGPELCRCSAGYPPPGSPSSLNMSQTMTFAPSADTPAAAQTRADRRALAIVAHVDHG